MAKTFKSILLATSTIIGDLKRDLLCQNSSLYVVGLIDSIASAIDQCLGDIEEKEPQSGREAFSSVCGRAKIDKSFRPKHHAVLSMRSIIRTIALTILFTICSKLILNAQNSVLSNLRLPNHDSLESSLESFYERERDAQLAAFDAGKKGDWKDVLPSVGITYTVSNEPRPAINWQPISIFNRKDAKRKQQLAKQSITLQYETLITDRLFKLRQMISDYNLDLEELDLKEKTLLLEERMYEIEVEKYNQSKLKPSDYFQEEKKILQARSTLQSFRHELLKRKSAVLYQAKYSGEVSHSREPLPPKPKG